MWWLLCLLGRRQARRGGGRGAQRRRGGRAAGAAGCARDAHRHARHRSMPPEPLRAHGCRAGAGRSRSADARRRRPDRRQPGRVRCASRPSSWPRPRGVETIGEIELASRWLQRPRDRGHRHEGQVHHHDASSAGCSRPTAATCWSAATSACRCRRRWTRRRPRRVHVVEVSSFQLETTTTFRPWIALWLNLADDHLDRHADLDEYAAAKARIFANQGPDDWAVINADDPAVDALEPRHRRAHGGVLAVGPASPTATSCRRRLDRAPHRDRARTGWCRCPPSSSPGAHMLGNVVAAVAVAATAGAGAQAMTRALHGFPRPRARDGAGGHQGRRPVRERLEGDQRRGGPPVDRELRPRRRGDRRRPLQGRRPARRCASRWRRAAGRWWRSARRRRSWRTRWPAWCPVVTAGSMREAVALAYPGGAARRRGAAGAGVRQLRLVRGLRRAWTRVQGGGGDGCRATDGVGMAADEP